jgi:hypothetical protein
VNFRLSQGGDHILVSDATGRLIDHVVFSRQDPDRSEGRWPDSRPAPFYSMSPPTPAGPNQIAETDWPEIRILDVRFDPALSLSLTWDAIPGRTYRVRHRQHLSAAEWTDLSPDVSATGTTATVIDTTLADDSQRYYQVVLVTGQSRIAR